MNENEALAAATGVVEHDERILAAHLQLHLGLTGHAVGGDLPTHTHGTGEADAVDFRAVDHGVADHSAAALYILLSPLA